MYSFEEETGIFYNKYIKDKIISITKSMNEYVYKSWVNNFEELTTFFDYPPKLEK